MAFGAAAVAAARSRFAFSRMCASTSGVSSAVSGRAFCSMRRAANANTAQNRLMPATASMTASTPGDEVRNETVIARTAKATHNQRILRLRVKTALQGCRMITQAPARAVPTVARIDAVVRR